MHKNLVTTFCMDESYNRLDSLKGFQHIVSDSSYGTFFSVYAKMNKENHPEDHNFFKIKDAVFYLQNFSGQVTVGIESVDPKIDMAYYESIGEPVYFVSVNVKSLAYQPFYPRSNNLLFDDLEDETLNSEQRLSGFEFVLKSDLSIINYENFDDLKIPLKDGYLINGYKIVFHLNFIENKDFITKDSIGKSIFLDDKYYTRAGELIISNVDAEQETPPIKPKNLWSAVFPEKGVVQETFYRPCKSGIVACL